MTKGQKFMVVCGIVAGAGLLLSVTGWVMGGRVSGISFGSGGIEVYGTQSMISEAEFQTGKEVLTDFNSMDIVLDYADLKIEPSDHFGISYHIRPESNFTCEVKNGSLNVTEKFRYSNSVANFTIFGFGHSGSTNYDRAYVTIYIPQSAGCDFETVEVYNDMGEIDISSLYADTLKLDADYGNVTLQTVGSADAQIRLGSGKLEVEEFEDGKLTILNEYGRVDLGEIKASDMDITLESGALSMDGIQGTSLKIYNDYGSIDIWDAVIANTADIKAESGKIRLDGNSYGSLVIENNYGSVEGREVKTPEAVMTLESGNCSFKSFQADNVEIDSDYGSVSLELTHDLSDYAYDLYTDYGRVEVGKRDMDESYRTMNEGVNGRSITVNCESGTIKVTQSK